MDARGGGQERFLEGETERRERWRSEPREWSEVEVEVEVEVVANEPGWDGGAEQRRVREKKRRERAAEDAKE